MTALACDVCPSPFLFRSLAREHGTPLLLLDCDRVRGQYAALTAALPNVTLHYAIKALAEPEVLATLRDAGSAFDLASSGEIKLLQQQGVPPQRTIHTHPIKSLREIAATLAYGCTTFVADNAEELRKFGPFRDRAAVLLRVSFRSPDAMVDLSKKFGCSVDEVLPLLRLAHSLGVRVRGLAFHVGSQCRSPAAHVDAINACRELTAAAALAGLPGLEVLDIGGGFPVPYALGTPHIEEFCEPIREALRGLPAHLTVIAEPGRFLVAPAMHGVASVVGKAVRGDSVWYYLDDGVYGAYSGKIYDGVGCPMTVLSATHRPARRSFVAGSTCDSVDMLAEDIWLPELEISDLVVGHMMGAYSIVSASGFNSLPKPKVVVLKSHPQSDWNASDEKSMASGWP